MEDIFINFCKNGKLDKLKKIYQDYNINIHYDNDVAFRCSCYYGCLDVAQWLYSFDGVNIHANNDDAFRWSCINGHLNVAQWLYSLGGVNIHANIDVTFRYSCCNGHINIAIWLYSLGVNIHAYNDDAFKYSCFLNHTEIIIWLLSIDKIDDEIVDDYLPTCLYEYAFNQGYLPIKKMVNTYAEYKNKIRSEIKEKNENGNIGVFELGYLVDIIMVYV